MTGTPRIGMFPPATLMDQGPDAIRAGLARIEDAGIDHVCCGDHVSFAGAGFDGLIQAAALSMLHSTLPVHIGVYLLPLRHPVLVARQLADIDRLAPGRLVFGVGVGGEDRHEVEVCGVDPASRGRRMDESLEALRPLLSGAMTTVHGQFFQLDRAIIQPPPRRPIPILVGGRSDRAVQRAGRFGDGWLGIWNSPRRFAEVASRTAEEAGDSGRTDYPARHAMQVWCGFGPTRPEARSYLADAMQAYYRIPYERFERYSPYGTVEDVAGFLAAYVAAGCREFNLIPQSPDIEQTIESVAEVRRLLAA